MRIALLHPTFWPEVRRGSERLAHDLGRTLAARGHDVTLLTTHRGSAQRRRLGGLRVVCRRRVPALPGMGWHDEYVGAAPAALAGLLRGRFDLAHALYPMDAWAASLARRLGGPPFVFSFHGIVNRRYLVQRRYRLEMFRAATAAAAATSALSEAAAEPLRRYALADPAILPGGVIGADFAGPVERSKHPTLLCTATLGDPRKRGELLLDAFASLRDRVPEARLVLAGGADPFSDPGPRAVPAGVELANPRDTAALARAYRAAWVTVLPSNDEAFGLVLVEALAAGTPIVAARSGGAAEIVADERVGRSFAPDDRDDLARAMLDALDLAGDARTVDACRARAGLWDWSRIVERYEDVYRSALGAG